MLLEPLVVLDHPEPGGLEEPDQIAVPEPAEDLDQGPLVVVDHRIAASGLVARGPQRVERERVGVRHRTLLLH